MYNKGVAELLYFYFILFFLLSQWYQLLLKQFYYIYRVVVNADMSRKTFLGRTDPDSPYY